MIFLNASSYQQGDPTANYRWTSWDWETIWFKLKTQSQSQIANHIRGVYKVFFHKWRKTERNQHGTGWIWKHLGLDQWTGITWLQMNRLSLRNNELRLRNNRLKFQASGKLRIILDESIEYISNYQRKTERSQHVTRLNLETLRFWPILPKNLPEHRSRPIDCAQNLPGHGLEARGDRPIQGVSRDFIHILEIPSSLF